MANTIWDFIPPNETCADPSTAAPYASQTDPNYFDLYCKSTRNSRKHKHAINHCVAMARYSFSCKHFPLGCDWIVAAASHAETEGEILPELIALLCALDNSDASDLPQLLRQPPSAIGKRLLGITLLRLVECSTFSLSRDATAFILRYIQDAVPDISSSLKLHKDAENFENVNAIRSVTQRHQELLQPIADSLNVSDLNSVLLRAHGINRALNNSLVAGMFSPFLPPAFAKTTIPTVLKSIEDLVATQDTTFVEIATRTRDEINSSLVTLEKSSCYYGLKYLKPFLLHLQALAKARFDSSDATKPASIVVESYPRKYPFHMARRMCRLRFEVKNAGPGPAADVELKFIFWAEVEPIEVHRTFSELEAGRCMIDIDVQIMEPIVGAVSYEVACSWRNYDGNTARYDGEGELWAQNPNVAWDILVRSEPYSMEAIELDSDRPFVGRETDVTQLVRAMSSKSMGSAYVYGQKRVGKTSLALAGAKRAQSMSHNLHAVYLEGGDYVRPTAEGTLQALGTTIARKLSRFDRTLDRIPVPSFTDSLAPLNEYVDDALEALSELRILIILDEFDELPLELYKRGPVGDGLFLTLRALSGRPRVGVILIGGEKMNPIIAAQGDQLNRFEAIRVDYFRKEDHWSDFQDLVRRPVVDAIEYSEGAVEGVFRWSNGNPFFTNMVCREIVNQCYDRRDAFVSVFEVEECANRVREKAGANSFQHFWEDGILDTGPHVEEVSIRRRRVLLALANVLRSGEIPSREMLSKQSDMQSISTSSLDRELKHFVERGVLTERNGEYSCRVYLFEQFLRERSAELISTEFTDQIERTRLEQEENAAYVTSGELVGLVGKWGVFVGTNITPEHVRSWLDQFGSNKDKRVMFSVLRAIRFYSESSVREKLRSAMEVVRRGTVELRREGERFRGDLLVTHLGGIAKSGTQYARLFCQENKILVNNAVGFGELRRRLVNGEGDIRGIVIVDDILGTGESAIESLMELNKEVGDAIRARQCPVFMVVICAFDDARRKVEQCVQECSLPIEIYVCDVLCEGDRAFSSAANIFESDGDRLRGKQLAEEKGRELEKKWPLGYGDCESLTVFFGNCPNNTLPILRKNGKEWRALFPRI